MYGYQTLAHPSALLPICQFSACGLTNQTTPTLLYAGDKVHLQCLGDMFVAGLVEIDRVVISSAAYRQIAKHFVNTPF